MHLLKPCKQINQYVIIDYKNEIIHFRLKLWNEYDHLDFLHPITLAAFNLGIQNNYKIDVQLIFCTTLHLNDCISLKDFLFLLLNVEDKHIRCKNGG